MTDERELPPDLLSAYVDDELTVDERIVVEAHLAQSEEWRDELDEVRSVRALLRQLPVPELAPDEWAALVALVADVDVDAGTHAAAPTGAPTDIGRSRRGRMLAWASAAAVAACSVVVVVLPTAHRVQPNVAAVATQHGAHSSSFAEPLSVLAPVGPVQSFRR